MKNITTAFQSALDAASAAQAAAPVIMALVELYRKVRDEFAAPPDSLTDAEIASELQTRGLNLRVGNDHWLSDHGFSTEKTPA